MHKVNYLKAVASVFLLVIAGYFIPKYREYNEFGDMESMLTYGILLGLIFFILGILLEVEKLLGTFKSDTFRIKWLSLTITVVIIILVSIPVGRWVLWFGSINYLFIPVVHTEIKAVLTLISGVLFVRSFDGNSSKER